MGVKWLYDNKIIGTGVGTISELVDWNPENKTYHPTTNTLYFDFGTAVHLTAFALLTGNADNGTVFIGYGHDSSATLGTVLAKLHQGTAKVFWDVGTYQYWKVALWDPTGLLEYDDSSTKYDDSAVTYDSIIFQTDDIAEIYLGKHRFFGEDPVYPFVRCITYTRVPLETQTGKRYETRKSKKRSWNFDYSNIKTSTKDNIVETLGTVDGSENPFWLSVSDDDTDLFIGRFDQESFTFRELTKNTWNVNFEVREE